MGLGEGRLLHRHKRDIVQRTLARRAGRFVHLTRDMAEGGIGNAKGYAKRTLVRFSWSHTLIISNRYSYFDPHHRQVSSATKAQHEIPQSDYIQNRTRIPEFIAGVVANTDLRERHAKLGQVRGLLPRVK